MRPSRSRILIRRALALALALALSAGAWLALTRDEDPEAGPERRVAGEPSSAAAALAASLTPAERVDQVLLAGFEGTDATAPIVALARERQLGGILVQAANWPDAASGAALVAELRAAGRAGGRIAPLIAVAQEGGDERPLFDLPPAETALRIGDSGSPERARRWAREGGAALREAGFDLNLFPVADVATLDSPLGDRAFSDDPALVAALTAAALAGCAEAGIACAPLHFPGLGAASQDTAQGPATVGLDPATLRERDLPPFRAAVEAGAPALVVSLALYSAYDPVTPGALAPAVAGDLLRDELRFEGVAITDDLASGAVRAGYRASDAAVAALAAGADLVQVSDPVAAARARRAILAALEAGELGEERLAQAAGRVLELKRELGLVP